MPTNRPRRHSLSSGDESFYPHPAKDGLPRRDGQRRARLPRSKSTSNVFDAFNRPPGATDHDMRNIALEQADIATLRELANFLRTTGPPPERPVAHDECLRFSGSGESRRWSLQSLRRKRTKLQRHSLQPHLPENAIPGTTVEGYPYIAISTPVPRKDSNASGPWFRSQYPVFLPQSQSPAPLPSPISSPKWPPARTSSKPSSASRAENGSPRGKTKHLYQSTRPNNKSPTPSGPIPERAIAGAVPNRTTSRAILNSVDEGLEKDPGKTSKKAGSERGSGMDQSQLQSQILGPVREEDDEEPEIHRQATPPHSSPPISEPRGYPRQSPSGHPPTRDSPRPASKSPKQLANILVQGGLTVPKENLFPESPGFPNMLATMSFPSPPKGSSRPSSPASTAPSVADSQVSLSSRPVVQPRTSSRRACASTTVVSTASLDTMVMQERPSSRSATTDRPLHVSTAADSRIIEPEAPTVPLKSPDRRIPEDVDGLACPAGSTGQMSETSGLVLCGRGEDSQRESLQSQLTATTNYSRHSTLTYSSSVSSCASKTSTESRDTITKPQPEKPTRSSAHAQLSLNTKCGNTEDAALKTAIDGEKDTDANASGKMDPDKQGDEPASPSKFSPASNSQQPKSIIERRLARKAKVHEYKMRDLDASRIDSVDSPVLGYFASNLPGRPSSPVEASSVPANSARRPSTLSMSMTTDEVSNGNDAEEISDLPHDVSLDEERSRPESDPKSASTPGLDLKISAVVSTGIEPVYVTPDWHNSGIAMSPIMVVADVESLPGSSILPSWSSRPRQDSISPRPVSILKPLKISTHSRQTSRSVTISRNPATGVIERSASGTVDPKFKRRSLMTIPTPPLSPEVTPLPRKRLSLPPVQLQIPVIPQDRSPLSQTQDFDSSSDEEVGSESRFRSTASLKERIMREKMQKEKEITDIVARTVGPPQKPTIYETEQDPVPLDQGNGESLEKRLRRLERTNDAWLCAMKPLLETMARTLDDMRVEDRCRSLRMSDFVLDKDTEAAHSIASRPGSVVKTTLKRPGTASSTEKKARNAAGASSAMPLSPIIQELEDDSPVLEKRESPTGSKRSSGPSQGQLTQGPGSFCSTQVGTGPAGQGGGEPNDWSDLGSRIRDMGVLPRNSQEELEVRARKGTHGSGNTLHPVMRDLMSASHLYADKVGGAP